MRQDNKNGFYCAKCGKYISTLTIDKYQWGYKNGSRYYCSYTCMRTDINVKLKKEKYE